MRTIAISCDRLLEDEPSCLGREISVEDFFAACETVRIAGLHPHILLTLHPMNYRNMPRYLACAQEHGCTIGFSILSCVSERYHDFVFSKDQLRELADIAFAEQASINELSVSTKTNASQGLSCATCCGAGRTCVSVSHDGSVYPCHMLHLTGLCAGNAFFDNAEAIRDGLAAKALSTVDEVPGCAACDIRYLCGGGCRARLMHAMDNRLLHQERCDPYCAFYQRAIGHQVNQLLGRG